LIELNTGGGFSAARVRAAVGLAAPVIRVMASSARIAL